MHWIIKQLSTRLVSMKYASKVFPTNMPRVHATLRRHLNRAHKCLCCLFKHQIRFVNGILFAIRGNVLYSTSPRELEFKKLSAPSSKEMDQLPLWTVRDKFSKWALPTTMTWESSKISKQWIIIIYVSLYKFWYIIDIIYGIILILCSWWYSKPLTYGHEFLLSITQAPLAHFV